MSIRQVSLRAAIAGIVFWHAAAAAPAATCSAAVVVAAAVRQFTD